jgi:hypothetical protein
VNGLLLALLLVQAGLQTTGAVTGIVRGADGMPASGVRVYAMTVRDAAEAATAGTALESIAQTDASGKYRLDVAPGRYYIASGSVGSPTYYPGTTSVAAARVFSIAAGGLIESIDFSSFVPASRTTLIGAAIAPLPPGSTGVLGGTIRFPDGLPAGQMQVVAIPAAALAGPGAGAPSGSTSVFTVSRSFISGFAGQAPAYRRIVNGFNIVESVTDINGRYRFENLPPETYYIATGTADAPQFFPGTSDLLAARTHATTPTTLIDNLDFTVPPRARGVPVSGRVTAVGESPAAGAIVQISSRSVASPGLSAFGLPARSPSTTVTARADGTFEAPRVLPGDYTVEARALGVRTNTQNISVADQPVTGLNFSIPIATLSGRILMEDGSALSNPQLFKEAVVTTVMNPNLVVSTVIPLAPEGTFSRFVEADEYRFFLGSLPDEYTITSITAGTSDLLKGTLKVTPATAVNIDIRVARRSGPLNTNDIRLSGAIRDNLTGQPAQAERVTLCCLAAGPWQGFSTSLRPDGSFEFAGIPPGRYELGLQPATGQPKLFLVDPRVEVAGGSTSGLAFLSTPQMRELTVRIVLEDGSPLPDPAPISVVFTGMSGQARVAAQPNGGLGYFAAVPAGDRYTVSVTNLPAGYVVKSGNVSVDVPHPPQVSSGGPVSVYPPVAPIQITVAPATPQPAR